MVTLDKIRLTGLLQRSPLPAGFSIFVGVFALAAGAATLPAPDAPLPRDAVGMARELVDTTASLRTSIDAWRASGDPKPPDDVMLLALYEERLYRSLARSPKLNRQTLVRLPVRLAAFAHDVVAAHRELVAITPPLKLADIRVGTAAPADDLLRWYREAQRRFGVPWRVLAAVNFVESAFGKLRSASAAGAQGPMQFLPATWRRYGLGGDVHDPHDAILGAANYLRASGARRDIRRALYAYNPSSLYVDAVLRYARGIGKDVHAFYNFYSWQVFVRTTSGERRITGPGLP